MVRFGAVLFAFLAVLFAPFTALAVEKYWVEPMIAPGANHTLALKADGSVWAWGRNSEGQLGIGVAGANQNTAWRVPLIVDPTETEFTVTISTGGTTVTKTNHGLAPGDAIRFMSTGSLPTGMTAGAKYYVIESGLTANAFQISPYFGSGPLATSGTQSGTHTCKVYSKLSGYGTSKQMLVSMTIGTPLRISKTGHNLHAGDKVTFSGTGQFPVIQGISGTMVSTTFYVSASNLDANTFTIAIAPGGSALKGTGSASGQLICTVEPTKEGFVPPSEPKEVTLTGGNPTTFTRQAHGLTPGDVVRFDTGSLPAGIVLGQKYYVRATGLTADAFQLSATVAGASVSTSVSSSGQFSYIRYARLKIRQVATGEFHSLALTAQGQVFAWGRNNLGQIGQNTTTAEYPSPTLISNYRVHSSGTTWVAPGGAPKIHGISAGRNHSMIYTEFLPAPLLGSSSAQVRMQYVFAWGENVGGQLALNDTTDRKVPTSLSTFFTSGDTSSTDIVGVACGMNHSTLVLRRWDATNGLRYESCGAGSNADGQIYNNIGPGVPFSTYFLSKYPIKLASGYHNTTFYANRWFTDAELQGDPTLAQKPVFNLGLNSSGQLGLNNLTTPNIGRPYNTWDGTASGLPTGLGPIRSLATGAHHTLATLEDGRLFCWGYNHDGVSASLGTLGFGGMTASSGNHKLPRENLNINGLVYVAAGGTSSFGVKADGSIYAWGTNTTFELGPLVTGAASTASKLSPIALTGVMAKLWTDLDPGGPDGMPDEWEYYYFGNLTKLPTGDEDQDGLTNLEEWKLGTHPGQRDTDGDGFTDKFESENPQLVANVSDYGKADYDNDGVKNSDEVLYFGNPMVADTDGDGINDSTEVINGTAVNFSWDGQITPSPVGSFTFRAELLQLDDPTYRTYTMVFRRDRDDLEVFRFRGSADSTVASQTIRLPGGCTYSVSIEVEDNMPAGSGEVLYTGEPSTSNFRYSAFIDSISETGYEVHDSQPSLFTAHDSENFDVTGVRAYLVFTGDPDDPCEMPALLSSINEATGPSHRKIALNGVPMPDSKPQTADESDEEKEETFVDALTLQLRHSVTDIYVSLPGGKLTLTARRDIVPEVWGTHPGVPPDLAINKPFGMGWSTNLCSNIEFVYYIKNTPNDPCAAERPNPDTAIVTDENGSLHRFIRIFKKDAQGVITGEGFLPYPSNRNEGASFLATLTKNPNGTFTFQKKFGNKINFSMTALTMGYNTNPVAGPTDSIVYTYARATDVSDRAGNVLVYNYTDTSLIPGTITANGTRSLTITKESGNEGKITSIQDPRGYYTSYAYSNKSYVDPYRGNVTYRLLSSVTRGNTTTGYTYEHVGPELDWTPYASVDDVPRQEYFYYSHLNGITNGNGGLTTIIYDQDRSRRSFSTKIGYYYSTPGQPRIVSKVKFPLLPGDAQRAESVFSNTDGGGVWVGQAGPGQYVACGNRMTIVLDTAGSMSRFWFDQGEVREQDEFENLFFGSNDLRRNPFLILYKRITIERNSYNWNELKLESHEFSPAAGMALVKSTDASGNITEFHYADNWSLPPELSWVPAGYFATAYSDPTLQLNANGDAKTFEYSTRRLMTKATDEEGRSTSWTVSANPNLDLRTGEKVHDAQGNLLRETTFEYTNATFPSFLTRKTIKKSVTDPAWAEDLVTEYVPDAWGYVAQEKVRLRENGVDRWLTTQYEYDANGNKKSVTDPRGNKTEFNYDTWNRLQIIKRPAIAGYVAQVNINYDAAGNKINEWNENTVPTFYEYDAWNRLKKTILDFDGSWTVTAADLVTEYGYNKVGSRTTVKDPNGYTTTTVYDYLQRPVTITNPLNQVTQFFYDGQNSGASIFDSSSYKPTKTIDARGYETVVEYDNLYRPVKTWVQYQKAPLADLYALSETEYDDVGNAIKVWDPLNLKTVPTSNPVQTDYDGMNRPVKVTFQDNRFATTEYTGVGQAWRVTDERGNATQTEYDSAGRAVKVLYPEVHDQNGNPITPIKKSVYDDAGNVTQTTDELNKTWDFGFDAWNRKTDDYAPEVWDALSSAMARPHTITEYSRLNKVTGLTDARGNKTTTKYDRALRAYEIKGPVVTYWNGTQYATAQATTTNTFDRNGNILTVTDPNNKVTTNTYDVVNRLLTTKDAENIIVTNTYDAAGNRLSMKDGKNQTTLFEYDGLNRLVKQTDPLGRADVFLYDGVNKTARIDALNRGIAYRYDARHRLSDVEYYNWSAPNTWTPTNTSVNAWRHYSRDFSGNLLTVTEAQKTVANCAYTYDALNRVLSETSKGVTHTYRYDAAGRRRFADYGGVASGTQEWQFDDAGRLTTLISDGTTTNYKYDLASNVVRQEQSNGFVTVQSFDELNRMTSRSVSDASSAFVQSYEQGFDLGGTVRRIAETYANAARNRVLDMTYDGAYRLTEEKVTETVSANVVTTTYGYDTANNRASKAVAGGSNPGTWTYTANSLNQITAVSGPGLDLTIGYNLAGEQTSKYNILTGQTTSYTFDHEGRLSSGTHQGTAFAYTYDYRTRRIGRAEAGVATDVIFSGGLSRAETISGSGTASVKFVRGRDLGGGVDGLLATVRSTGVRYVNASSRGDVTLETDSTGATLYSASYEAFGTRTQQSGSSSERQRANTKEEDFTGLLNEGLRYRDLDLGSFITRDPAGFVDGPNVYTYVRQNPWSKFDPDGLQEASWIRAAEKDCMEGKEMQVSARLRPAAPLVLATAAIWAAPAVYGYALAYPAATYATVEAAQTVGEIHSGYDGPSLPGPGELVKATLKVEKMAVAQIENSAAKQAAKAEQVVAKSTDEFKDLEAQLNQLYESGLKAQQSHAAAAAKTAEGVKPPKIPGTEMVDINKLQPPAGGRDVFDPNKLKKMGAFDWAKYQPIEVLRRKGAEIIQNGMTRVEAARRAGIQQLPAKVTKE